MVDIMSYITIIISILALVISGWSLKISRTSENDRRKEMQTAVLIARINRRIIGDKGDHEFSLEIKNSGKAMARNIEISIDGNPALKYHYLVWGAARWGGLGKRGIINELDAGTDIEYPLMYGAGNPARMNIELHWSDDSGIQRSFKSLLLPVTVSR